MENTRKPPSASDDVAPHAAAPPATGSGALSVVDRALCDALGRGAPPATFAIALSGGLDSMVLLDALARRAIASPRVPASSCVAIHVHHGISPHADAWLRHCEHACAARGVPFLFERVTLGDGAGQGIEAAARKARYAVLERIARARGAQALLLAQHADDQAETVLLQMLRGAGLPGLSAMPEARTLGAPDLSAMPETRTLGTPDATLRLLRPFLALRRDQLEAYAAERALTWVEDASNQDARHRRNALRHQVLPALATHFPDYRRTLARTARHAAAAQALCDELARDDLSACAAPPGARATGSLPRVPVLTRAALRGLSERRLANVLRFWIRGAGLPAASEARLGEMIRQLRVAPAPHATLGAASRIEIAHAAHLLLGYRDQVFWTHDAARAGPDARAGREEDMRYAGQDVWRLPAWRGELRFETATDATRGAADGEGPDGSRASRDEITVPAACLRGARLSVRERNGGERLRLGAGRPSRSLKQHFQHAGVAPSQRDVPLFHLDGRLFFVPSLGGWVCASAQCATPAPRDGGAPTAPVDPAAGIRLRWIPWRDGDH